MEVAGENWLIPVSAELRSDADVESEAISLRSVSLQVSRARKLGLVILDACRNNPFAAKMKRSISTRAVTRGLAPSEPSENVLIAYAARDGTTASDGDGRNSPFTASLLRHIETPGLEISFLFRRVRDDVMEATRREQQPFVYGSLSKEEIYLRAPVAIARVPAASNPVAASAEDEKFWRAIETSSGTALFEEFLARYPRSNHVSEARQRIMDLKASQTAAVMPSGGSSLSSASTPEKSDTRAVIRNVFGPEDNQRVIAIAAAQALKLPSFTIPSIQDEAPNPDSRFVGVWSNKRGWSNGKGRYTMVIITEVSSTRLARGYYIWGPPTRASWIKDEPGYRPFAEYIADNKFSIAGISVAAKLENNVLTLSSSRKENPSEKASIDLSPVWQLTSQPEQTDASKRATIQRPRAAKKADTPEPRSSNGAASFEERYRSCKKLVKGFARRDACARTGVI